MGGSGLAPVKLLQDLETLPIEGSFTYQSYLVHTINGNGKGWFPTRTLEIVALLPMGFDAWELPLEGHLSDSTLVEGIFRGPHCFQDPWPLFSPCIFWKRSSNLSCSCLKPCCLGTCYWPTSTLSSLAVEILHNMAPTYLCGFPSCQGALLCASAQE